MPRTYENFWAPLGKLRAWYRAGLPYEEIADLNEEITGFRPTVSTISKKMQRMGEEPRQKPNKTLLPWKVKPEHWDHRFRYMLQCEARRRECPTCEQSATCRKWAAELARILGESLVVSYDQRIGWHLVDRLPTDKDVIRRPEAGTEEVPDEVSPDIPVIMSKPARHLHLEAPPVKFKS